MRAARDDLFASHPQSPIQDRKAFTGLRYFPFDPAAVREVVLGSGVGSMEIDTGGPDGVIRYRRLGIAETAYGPLTLWWIDAYGGGLFLPFRDGTSGHESYGGGRYLTDAVKGTHGRGVTVLSDGRVRPDFNYAYNRPVSTVLNGCPPWLRRKTGSTFRSGEHGPTAGLALWPHTMIHHKMQERSTISRRRPYRKVEVKPFSAFEGSVDACVRLVASAWCLSLTTNRQAARPRAWTTLRRCCSAWTASVPSTSFESPAAWSRSSLKPLNDKDSARTAGGRARG